MLLVLCFLYYALVFYPFADVAEVFVRELIEDGVQRMVKEAGREDDERRLMALEDEASRRRREEDDRLNAERLRLLSEKRRREEEERRQLLALLEIEIQEDIEREVVEEELRKLLQVVLDELEAQRRAEEEERRRLSLEMLARALAEKTAQDAIDAALLNMTGGYISPLGLTLTPNPNHLGLIITHPRNLSTLINPLELPPMFYFYLHLPLMHSHDISNIPSIITESEACPP